MALISSTSYQLSPCTTGGSQSVRAGKYFGYGALSRDAAGFSHHLVAGEAFTGFATKGVASATEGDELTTFDSGLAWLPIAGITQADCGKDFYAFDDGTFTLISAGNSLIGKVKRTGAGTAYVNFKADYNR